MIKKFKNGKLCLSIVEEVKKGYFDDKNIYNFIYNDMTNHDLYICTINGCNYIVDFGKEKVYDFNYFYLNDFLNDVSTKKMYLVAYDNEICNELLEDMEED